MKLKLQSASTPDAPTIRRLPKNTLYFHGLISQWAGLKDVAVASFMTGGKICSRRRAKTRSRMRGGCTGNTGLY